MFLFLSATAAIMSAQPSNGASVYTSAPKDPRAVYLTAPSDGTTDNTAAIQSAIDRIQETTGQGILFIPAGRYRISRTLVVWPGIRLIGCGSKRPTFLLADNTPGYQTVEKFMVFFAGRRSGEGDEQTPDVPPEEGLKGGDFSVPNEANPGTFYSAMSNIDLEVGTGNPGAVGIRGRYAQHCFLSHIDFRLQSGLAGIHDIGNEADDLRFYGGEYGIITRTPSPGWQFTLLDGHFEGQSKASIRTHVTGLTLIRPSFKNVPTAISVEPDETEQLWIKGGHFEAISGPALEFGREQSLRTQINIEGVGCKDVPTFALMRESGRKLTSPAQTYEVETFSHGLSYENLTAKPKIETRFTAKKLDSLPYLKSDVPPLPGVEDWANVHELGAVGDGKNDDTEAIRRAIAGNRVLYFPSGKYRVTDTISVKPDTVLIGLNPITTQILIADGTPAFSPFAEPATGQRRRGGVTAFAGEPRPLLETPKDGTNIVTGIGLDTGGNNPAAVACIWHAGTESLMNDVKFLGGHGSNMPVYNANNSADPDPNRHWDSQYPSLWVKDGGGGTFKNIWTASTFAQAGMRISDTTTEGRVYQLSSEHHVRNEVQLHNVSNWEIVALQTEEERGESSFALPLEIQDCHNITIANLNMYRVVSVFQSFPQAIKVSRSRDIRFRNVHCYSNSKASFDNLLTDESNGIELRQREFAWLTLTNDKAVGSRRVSNRVHKLAGGFYNISGGAVSPNGDFYFVDAHWQRIFRWSVEENQATLFQDANLYPTNLTFDRSGNLMVVSYAGKGTVYAIGKDQTLSILKPEASQPRPDAVPAYPVTDWEISPNVVHRKPLSRPYQFVSPDGSVFIPAGQDFIEGRLTWGVKLQDIVRTFGLEKAKPGQRFYVTGESEMRTYSVAWQPDGTMTDPKLFAEQGGECVTTGPDGNIYLAAGQVYVYSPNGKLLDTIETPERPIQLAFGGKDGKTLFIAARTSLYSVRVP